MQNLQALLRNEGHYAAFFEDNLITNSMYSIRKHDRGFTLTNDQDGKEMLFGTEKAVVDFLNLNGNADMIDFLKGGRSNKGFFLQLTHTPENVSESRRQALHAAHKRIQSLETQLLMKNSTTQLSHCEICGRRLSQAEKIRFKVECELCNDHLKEVFKNIPKGVAAGFEHLSKLQKLHIQVNETQKNQYKDLGALFEYPEKRKADEKNDNSQ